MSDYDNMPLTIILPCKDEGASLERILPKLIEKHPEAEIIVVNDGSSDNTQEVCERQKIRLVNLPYNMGNGAAVKAGVRSASNNTIVLMDADGQHKPEDIPRLLEKLEQGFDMVVGARDASGQASIGRLVANTAYNKLASWMVRHKIEDLTSGFRAVRADRFREFLHLLPNGFSYPTTCTIAFFRSGYSVSYVPIKAEKREGKSHIKIARDGVRFLLIIFKVISLYSPLKIFFPLSVAHFILGLSYYLYTYSTMERFTNMSALLFSMAIFIFLIGLVSEQITMLLYQKRGRE